LPHSFFSCDKGTWLDNAWLSFDVDSNVKIPEGRCELGRISINI